MFTSLSYTSKLFYTFSFQIDIPCQGAAAAQQLPKHLRRRAVSHNVNRLPRRLRSRHNAERAKSDNVSSGGIHKKPKRPSRKYRRRPSNLLSEYERRQKGEIGGKWLETHIWHAKRFHMAKTLPDCGIELADNESKISSSNPTGRWGYNLAEYCNDKVFRACYRGVSKKCIIHDLSYLGCIEISGRYCDINDSLAQITPISRHSFFSSPEVLNGSREGIAWLYHPGTYPFGAIGNVSFTWKPSSAEMDDHEVASRTLWVWSHPSFYDEVWEILKIILDLRPIEKDNPATVSNHNKFKDVINEKKLSSKNIPQSKLSSFISSKYPTSLIVVPLRDTLNRFRLLGPLSQIILFDTLKKTDVEVLEQPMLEATNITNNNRAWWMSIKDDAKDISKIKWDFWSSLGSKEPGHVMSGIVLGLTVRDPRKLLPIHRQSIETLLKPQKDEILVEDNNVKSVLPNSPLWEASIRDEVTLTKVPDHCINAMRSKFLTPGVEILPLDDEETRIPVMLIHQDGEDEEGAFGDGWDILLPAGWGMSFWMNFVYRGAKVVGQKELMNSTLEMKKLPPLKNAPDSKAGMNEMMREAELLSIVHFSYPPDKRPSFLKLGSSSPFLQPWNVLIDNWSSNDSDQKTEIRFSKNETFNVLRDSLLLKKISHFIKNIKDNEGMPNISANDHIKTLLPVYVTIVGKGTLGPNTMIALPSEEDINLFVNSNVGNSGVMNKSDMRPKESLHLDECPERKKCKSLHESESKNLQRKCKNLSKKILSVKCSIDVEQNENTGENAEKLNTLKELSESLRRCKKLRQEKNIRYNVEMKSLWGLDYSDIKNVKLSCSRKIVGYINFGGQSLRNGSKSIGLGFVSLVGFFEYLSSYIINPEVSKVNIITRDKGILVLLRPPDSLHYSFGLMKVNEKMK